MEVHAEVRRVLDDGADLAAKRWQSWCDGVEPSAGQEGGSPQAVPRGGGVVGGVGSQDPEHPGSVSSASPLHLQYLLTRVADGCAARGLVEKFKDEQRWDDVARLSDLSDKDANHDWLWSIHPNKAKHLEAEEYVSAVRLRLGCGGPLEPAICGNCGKQVVGCNGTHSLLCAKGESTRGHNAIRDELHSMALQVDASAETEPEGLIPSHPRLRPADVLTGAFHNGRLAAVDVGVISPAASGAGADCVVTMDQRKRERMEPFREELEASGVECHPFAVSCWGRLHPGAEQMLQNLAKRKARRQGLLCQREVVQRLRARITTEVMRRAARMVLSCLPRAVPDELEAQAASNTAPSHDAEARAGDPGTTALPPFHTAPPSGATALA